MKQADKLSKRNTKWVSEARKVGDKGECSIEHALRGALPATYEVTSKPRLLAKVYGTHGVVPDLMIKILQTANVFLLKRKPGIMVGMHMSVHTSIFLQCCNKLPRKSARRQTTRLYLCFLARPFSRKSINKKSI